MKRYLTLTINKSNSAVCLMNLTAICYLSNSCVNKLFQLGGFSEFHRG